ncbi:outer membrane protein TolC [Silvibacterium bohemicum]|uniref:Outer membrane protein TolC n=1 Tax=Silvibacterium bohemicum TaxID=1577686 RepID=A0A841K4E4_9BACT|nr:TolC family protein [Silvibacterium bohemicum]MBB6146809.1 outer membrane protein TolC [Silvibacterium bohemicum]
MNVVSLTATLVLVTALSAFGQTPVASTPTSLSQLLAEAGANNPQISAADHGVRAVRQTVPQVATLPDPKFTYQQFSVGSPKPFAGYTNSDFAYIGVGASQELPYPGKLRAREDVAERDADTKQAEVEVTKTSIADAVKADYLQLAYLQQTLGILRQNESVLDQLIQDATTHYQVGQGMQQDVLQAQVNRTKIVKEITMHHQQMGEIQAHLKGLLSRDQGSPDIVTEDLVETPIKHTSDELLAMIRQNNPRIQVDASSIRRQEAQLASAKREGKPDFEVGYLYENTDRKYRDYYMFTFDVRFPRKKRVDAEIAEATEKRSESQQTLNAHLQQQLAEVQEGYVKATSDEELLKEYREGLVPQSDAAYRATLSAYASNREPFVHVLSYFTDLLSLRLEYAQTLVDHEAALAHLETLTGATLR